MGGLPASTKPSFAICCPPSGQLQGCCARGAQLLYSLHSAGRCPAAGSGRFQGCSAWGARRLLLHHLLHSACSSPAASFNWLQGCCACEPAGFDYTIFCTHTSLLINSTEAGNLLQKWRPPPHAGCSRSRAHAVSVGDKDVFLFDLLIQDYSSIPLDPPLYF